ncbi:MAG: V-type ATP synthase subunit B [Defluviitaleaceae bacterium]|nr:V-type ATP synthase subunit B [Defluviitaleaceae bacterium]MCL2276231.1 V-type ATP synthase subunit B [Defluviitaleaceae bacterium]
MNISKPPLRHEYLNTREIRGSLVILEGVQNAAYDEIVTINGKTGRVIEISGDKVIILVFDGTQAFTLADTRTRFTGQLMKMPLSVEMLGRTFNGAGLPMDSMGALPTNEWREINGTVINPVQRVYPRFPVQTGFSAIDGMATLVRGQKLPIFSADGLPHNELAARLAVNAQTVVFAAMGVSVDTMQFFQEAFDENNARSRAVLFINLASDPPAERLITPRLALTAAEYLAFTHGHDVLVILTDMTAYVEALREISSARGEIPGRKGYPGYLYSELASLYERAGCIKGKGGSVTQIPILTMPGDDITHPIADLTGYSTEGQIVLDRQLHRQHIFPPVAVLPSLSRLMKDGIGEGKTHAVHADTANRLFAAYAKVADARALLSIIGEEDMTEEDQKILQFGERFETELIHHTAGEVRTFAQTIEVGLALLAGL